MTESGKNVYPELGKTLVLPAFDVGTLMTLILAILDLGTMRSWEKTKVVQGKHDNMSLSKNDQAIFKNLINEAFKSHWEDNCRPHEERLSKTEKQLVIVFENGLKSRIQEAIDGVKELIASQIVDHASGGCRIYPDNISSG